jgi:sirohydrochlorin cobaltochelatase
VSVHSRAVLLIGHGTRDDEGTVQFFELGKQLAACVDPLPVATALLEFQEPTIPQAWDTLVAAGARHIHVAPLLLFAAGHAKQDIPEIIRECQAKTPHVSYDQSRPISRHPDLVQRVTDLLRETMQSIDAVPTRTALLMVGRGSHDPCAQADMRVLSEVVSYRLKLAATVTAFYAMAEPRLPDVLRQLVDSGRYDTVIVHPHLLFEGRLHQAIVQLTAAANQASSTRCVASPYLGPDKLVATAIAGRMGFSGE